MSISEFAIVSALLLLVSTPFALALYGMVTP